MCGICGWVDYEHPGAPDARRELAAMTETMACRGPDQEGTWVDGPVALGHRRLAVIDVPGGRQPMTLPVGDQQATTIVYSGETYNFRELRERLAAAGHRCETNSDTEVVLHAHQEWGGRDPRHAVARAVDLDDDHAPLTRVGVLDRVRGQFGHAGHDDFPARAAGPPGASGSPAPAGRASPRGWSSAGRATVPAPDATAARG